MEHSIYVVTVAKPVYMASFSHCIIQIDLHTLQTYLGYNNDQSRTCGQLRKSGTGNRNGGLNKCFVDRDVSDSRLWTTTHSSTIYTY